jgi:hypothetical protein
MGEAGAAFATSNVKIPEIKLLYCYLKYRLCY